MSDPLGHMARTLSPQLAEMTIAEMAAILDAHAAAGTCIRGDHTIAGDLPMQTYQYRDGTLVRLQPRGSAFGTTPKYCVEVVKQPGGHAVGLEDVAFKVMANGRATPKCVDDLALPYEMTTNPVQYKAYVEEALRYGHLDAKREP